MPETLEALIVFLILSVPAYLTITCYKKRNLIRYYRDKHAPIEQIAFYFFVGTVVNLLTIFYLGLLWGVTILIRNFSTMTVLSLNLSTDSVEGLFAITFLLLIVYFVTAVVWSFVIGDCFAQILPYEEPLLASELHTLKIRQLREDADGSLVWMQLKNGDRCLGFIREYRWIGDEDNAMELIFEKTYYQLAHSEKREGIGRAILRSNDILCFSIYPSRGSDSGYAERNQVVTNFRESIQ